MEKFPILKLIVRFGAPISLLVGIIVAAVAILAAWTLLGYASVIVGLALGVLSIGAMKSYVELIVLITDMLLPQ
jgi:hypothetical protein